MSGNSHGTRPFVPAAQKISQPFVPSGSGVYPILNTHHNSYSISTEFSPDNDVAMNGISAGEQNHQYQFTNAPSSTPRTAYPNSVANVASHSKRQGYHTAIYPNHSNGDREHQRHITSPTVAPHGVQYSPASWDPRSISRQQPLLQDTNYTHPHNMTNHSPYNNTSSYGRPPHHPVEPNAAPSPPNQYPSSPRTPQTIGTDQLSSANTLPTPSGLRQPVSSMITTTMSAPSLNGSHQEMQQEQRRDRQHSHRADHHHRPPGRNSLVEPVHDSKYSPLPQTNRLITSEGSVRRLSGMDLRPENREHISHQFGTPAPMNSQNNYYSNSSPLSPGSKLGSMRNDSTHFSRGYQYNSTHSEGYHLDDKSIPDKVHSEGHPYSPGLESQLRRPSLMEVQKTSPQNNTNMSNGHSNHQEYSQNRHHDDTDDDDEIKRETISRTASASVSPSATRNLPRTRRDSIDSIGSTSSGREGSKKRGGPVFTDHTEKQYYEEDIIPPEIASEVPRGWQIGTGKKCLNKLLPLFKDGLPVFPEWGLTSAGKARQRLPKACASCRTKKIKCVESEQDDSKCQHCEKMRISCSQDEEEKPARKNSKKISEKKRRKDGVINQEPGAMGSAPPGVLPLNGAHGVPASSKKRKTFDDGSKPGSFSKRGKSLRENTFSMEPLDGKASGMDSSMNNSKSIVRHQQSKIQSTPVQREKKLAFATHETITSVNVTDEGLASRSYNSRLLAEQYSYGSTGKHTHSETPPNSYTSASPTTSISMDHPITYGVNNPNQYETGSGRISITPTLTSTAPLIVSIPHPLGEDPRHSQLPNPDVLKHFVDVYFTHVYSQTYAFLHRRTFTETLGKHPPVLLFSLCAVAARFSEVYSQFEEDFAKSARKLIFENYDNYCVEVVQSMIHMGLHDFGSSNGDKAWMFCGMAVRMGSALNLNLENGQAKSGVKSPIAREIARRTYWSYYLMDRFNGYGVARPFLTQDHDCHVQLPCNQPSFRDGKSVTTQHLLCPNPSEPLSGDTYMGAMAFLVRVVGIWGNILKQIHLSGFDKGKDMEKESRSLIENLETWRKTLPHGLEYSNENLAGQIKVGTVGAFVTMHVMWHTAMAYVHRYVRTMGSHKEISNSNATKETIVQSIRKTFVHADAVLLIMCHVRQKKVEAQRMDNTKVIVNAPFLGQAISDACDISIIRALELKGEPGVARDQKERVFVGLEWLKELRRYWKPLEGMYRKLRKSCRGMERSISRPPSDRMGNVISSPDSGNSSELLATYPMFQYPIDPTTYDLQPGIDIVDQPIPASTIMGQQNWYGVPEHFYEVAFVGSALSLYGIAEAEGGFPQLYLDPDSAHPMRSDMDDMVTSLAPTSSVAYQTEMQGHTILDQSSTPLLSQQSLERIQGYPIDSLDLENSDNDEDEDERTNGGESVSRRERGKQSISTLYFHPNAVLDGKLADTSGSENSGSESRRPSEAPTKAETNPMDVLHLLVTEKVLDTHYVSKAVETKNPSDLGTGREGAMVPDDQSLTGEVSVDNSKDHGIYH